MADGSATTFPKLPRLELQLSDIRLSEPHGTNEFASLKEGALSLALWPLLSKSVVVDRISARGLSLSYVRDAKGKSNIDDRDTHKSTRNLIAREPNQKLF